MVIFSVIGIALIALLRQSTTFLEKGQAGSEIMDVMENIDRQLADDFANVYIRPASSDGVPDVRFVCDRIGWDVDNDGVDDTFTPRLCFVRSVSGEASDPTLRRAGQKPGATEVVDGLDDTKESEEEDHRAAGGKGEATWILEPDARGKEDRNGEIPSLGTLHRGFRAAVGGGPTRSYQPLEPWGGRKSEASRMGITTRQECADRLRPVLAGVLHVEYRFWSRHVRPEAARLVTNGRLNDEVPADRGGGGLSPVWDSTRGIFPKGTAEGQFFLGRGPASLADPVDDVFPSRIRVTLVVDRVGKDASTAELTRTIGPEDTTIPCDNTRFAPGGDPAGKFIKIGREWIQWATKDSRGFMVEKRGARGTRREAHESGSTVRAGSTMVREYPVPVHREDWND